MFDQEVLPSQSGTVQSAIDARHAVQTVEPGSPEEEAALAILDNVREAEQKEMRPGERARARARHRRHWARHARR